MIKVFTYGIFLDEYYTNSVFNREVKRQRAMLTGYKTGINEKCGFLTIIKTNSTDIVEGEIIELNDFELMLMDRVEGIKFNLYERIKVVTNQGLVYSYIEAK